MKSKEPRFDRDLNLGPLAPYGTTVYIDSSKTRYVGNACPYCRKSAEGATRLSETLTKPDPKPGDFNVCTFCAGLSRYDADLKLRGINRRDRRMLLRCHPELKRMAAVAIKAINELKRGVN